MKSESEEEAKYLLEDENKKEGDNNHAETDLTKDDLHKGKSYYETDKEVNKGKQESKEKVKQDLDNDFEETLDGKKALLKSKKGIFYLK